MSMLTRKLHDTNSIRGFYCDNLKSPRIASWKNLLSPQILTTSLDKRKDRNLKRIYEFVKRVDDPHDQSLLLEDEEA
jgi:hypothetical protein